MAQLKQYHQVKALLCAALLCVCAGLVACRSVPGGMPDTPWNDGQTVPPDGTDGVIPSVEDNSQPDDSGDAVLAYLEESMAALPRADFGGATITIATDFPSLFAPESDEGLIDKAIYVRNSLLEETYHIQLAVKDVAPALAHSEINRAVLAGEQYADFVSLPMVNLGNLAASGLLLNLRSVPFIDFEAECFADAGAQALTVQDRTYALFGDALLQSDFTWGVMFNADLMEQLGCKSPYTLYRDGRWTWQELLTAAECAPLDLNQNGRRDMADRYGQSSLYNSSDYINAVYLSGGHPYFAEDEDGYPAMSFYTPQMQDALSMIGQVTRESNSLPPLSEPGEDALTAFSEGRLLFLVYRVSGIKSLDSIDFRYGLVPLPKWSADQQTHFSYLDSHAYGISVPVNHSNTERTGLVLSGFYTASNRLLADAIKSDYVNFYLPDNTSALMLNEITRNATTDLAYFLGEGYPDIAEASYEILYSVINRRLNFQTLYEQNEKLFGQFVRDVF